MQTEVSLTKSVPFFRNLTYAILWKTFGIARACSALTKTCLTWFLYGGISTKSGLRGTVFYSQRRRHLLTPNWKTLLRYGSFCLFVFVVLKQSSIDGCGEDAWVNQDNPVSGTHQVPKDWKPQWKFFRYLPTPIQREGRAGSKKSLTQAQAKTTHAKWLDHQRSAVKMLGPWKSLKAAPHTITTETAGQHCLAFNLT